MLNFPFFMDLIAFAIKNDMPGYPFGKAKDFILDIVNDAIRYPLNAPLHADSIDTLVSNSAYVYQMYINGPCMLPDTSIRLQIALSPAGWNMHASFRPANGGHSDIFDHVKDSSVIGTGAIRNIVWNTRRRANAEYVKNNLKIGQKLTMNADNLSNVQPLEHGYISADQWLCTGPDLIVAEHLDELTVTDIKDNGDVFFSEANRQVPFSLSPDEVVAMMHGSC
jgi:hypothetical protein